MRIFGERYLGQIEAAREWLAEPRTAAEVRALALDALDDLERSYRHPSHSGTAALRRAAAELISDDSPTGHDDRCSYGPPGECDCHIGRIYRWLIGMAERIEAGDMRA